MKFEDIKRVCEWLANDGSNICGFHDYYFGDDCQCEESICTDERLQSAEVLNCEEENAEEMD